MALLQLCKNQSRLLRLARPSIAIRATAIHTKGEDSSTSVRTECASQPGNLTQKLSLNQKRYLLFALSHNKLKEVPDVMSTNEYDSLRTRARIHVNVIMVALTVMLCLAAVYSGKSKALHGESLASRNAAMHDEALKKKE